MVDNVDEVENRMDEVTAGEEQTSSRGVAETSNSTKEAMSEEQAVNSRASKDYVYLYPSEWARTFGKLDSVRDVPFSGASHMQEIGTF